MDTRLGHELHCPLQVTGGAPPISFFSEFQAGFLTHLKTIAGFVVPNIELAWGGF